MTKEFLTESHLVDLSDSDLKDVLGYTYHTLKNLDEAKKNDPDIAQMRAQLKAYVDDNYSHECKRLKARMKAARALAATRGIEWKEPDVK